MSNDDEKNIVVNRGQLPTNPYGSGTGRPSNRDGWSFGWGGSGGGEGGRPGTLSGSKRRRLRLQDKQRREREARQRAEEAARAQAEAQAIAVAEAAAQARRQTEAEAQQRAEGAERVRAAAAEAAARAEQARVIAAHQHALESLPHAQMAVRAELDKKYADAVNALPASLAAQTQSAQRLPDLNGQPLLNAILREKAEINYLVSQKTELSKSKHFAAQAFANIDPLQMTTEQYKAILGSRSTNTEQAHQVHQAWVQAYQDALDANVLRHAVEQLNHRSNSLSEQYATHTVSAQQTNDRLEVVKHLAEANRLWSVVAGPTAPDNAFPSAIEKAKAVAEKLFTRKVASVLGRALPHLALLYPTELANSELGPSILATAASEVGVSPDVDLSFIASRKGTVDVSHRLTLEEKGGVLTTTWVKADGFTVGKQVAVRTFVYNPTSRAYEFTRDGETKPTLIWTPAVSPANSSTFLPSEIPDVSVYVGTTLSDVFDTAADYPTYDIEDLEDLFLVFPEESGLQPIYLVFNQRIGDHKYHSKPTSLLAFPDAKQVHGKTRIQGGGKTRPRWKDNTGNIYEWDFRHGTVEKYNKRGAHLGEYNAETGVQTKPADTTRKIEP